MMRTLLAVFALTISFSWAGEVSPPPAEKRKQRSLPAEHLVADASHEISRSHGLEVVLTTGETIRGEGVLFRTNAILLYPDSRKAGQPRSIDYPALAEISFSRRTPVLNRIVFGLLGGFCGAYLGALSQTETGHDFEGFVVGGAAGTAAGAWLAGPRVRWTRIVLIR